MPFVFPPWMRIAGALFGFVVLMAGSQPASAQTLEEINKASGFHEMLAGLGPSIVAGIKSVPGPEKVKEALSAAAEGAFDADRMEKAVEARMTGRLQPVDLTDLAAFFDSPLGRRVTALEIQASDPQAVGRKKIEGPKILGGLQAGDPARLALYRKIVDDTSAVDMAEAIALNMGYAMVSGMLAAAGQPLSDQQIMVLVHKQAGNLREKAEKGIMEGNAFAYRDLSLDDLRLYAAFLASPAGSHYYDRMQTALGAVMTDEARSLGQRFFVALGYRKA
ncbi:DUF2059 domain-containing protein [Mesorhizobium ciceri]|uniref:DUF2059 domain-containing protein n=1 Tax=Mesorhizobium TaxID=68287 RepID=UPI0007A9595A|nr:MULTISPECIES: DUF2059 domain-containing protein [Mesorhizobium]AMY01094.1 hypothetical protein A4R29_17555 [Mesorhizobium ciceri biovar biserrulae]MBZ9720716.1 DUF2059 domain-containing protein [Mesorhizobium sp. AD1-1]RUX72855.1 DUF2059 domain-containing protein [Mesorhizobium sp. M7A.F.Ca.US.005.03.1.1]RUY08518.1 DUF2059 domain-containing protein [Mesorhizobium sp. M7A.F.Ca.US.005.03.2.1]RUY23726.1 DUF2059 domain-containing protein [Mesorhizobium sp. M7A.F.Ca.US.001.04.2.1]